MYHERDGHDLAAARPDRRRRARKPHRLRRRVGERVEMLGEPIDLVRPEEVLLQVRMWVEDGVQAVVANHNLHSLCLVRDDPAMRAFYDHADLIQLDSKPLVWFGRLKGLPVRGVHRSTYLDWRDHFWSLANRMGWRVFYVGGAEGVAARAAETLAARYPKATIATRSGYFDMAGDDNRKLLTTIDAFRPHILFVGMGMPRQEAWIADNLAALPDCVVFNVGAAFDYEAGTQKAAPRWMGRLGIEWLFRLVSDPKRLFVRYCVEPWRLMGPALADLRQGRAGRVAD